MDFDFNNHMDEGANPRPLWQSGSDGAGGVQLAANDWKYRPNIARTTTNAAASPIYWDWLGADHRMQVGLYTYKDPNGDYGYTRLYNSGTDQFPDGLCNEAQQVYQARVYLNTALIDGTPGWFFESVARHELGHGVRVMSPTVGHQR